MKHLFVATAAISLLSACGGAPPNEKILTDSCTELFSGDARSESMITEDAGTDVASFCACYAVQTVADTETTALHKDILTEMVSIKTAGGLNVEDTADRIEDGIESGAIDTFSEAQFDALGDEFQALSRAMYDNGGSCPTTS
ncbi:MAG: hypothetical protein NXH88_08920 [Hyphomonas sp.]|nr:hypothetical protein [Hyphomonas sp.]